MNALNIFRWIVAWLCAVGVITIILFLGYGLIVAFLRWPEVVGLAVIGLIVGSWIAELTSDFHDWLSK
jgi:hypothetical protein